MLMVTETDDAVHVLPDHGKTHILNGPCWCGPIVKEYEKTLIVHEVEN